MAKRQGGRMQAFSAAGSSAVQPSEDWFEVFISGKGYPHNLANISSKTVKQVILDAHGNAILKSS